MDILEIENRVKSVLGKVFSVCDADTEDIKLEHELSKDLGLDSMDLVETMQEIEKEFYINVDDDIMTNIETVGELVNYVNSIINKTNTKYEMEKIPQTSINDYLSLHSKFGRIAQEIFTIAKLKTNLLKYKPSTYAGFYMTTEDLVIIYTSTQDSEEKGKLKIGVKHLIDGTWKEYLEDISKKAWTCLDRDMKEHLKSRYANLKNPDERNGEISEYQRGQIELMESIYGKTNLEL